MKGPFGLRTGTWKYITPGGASPRLNDVPGARQTGRKPQAANAGPALFDLSSDLGETRNLAAERPEKVKELQELLAKIRGQ